MPAEIDSVTLIHDVVQSVVIVIDSYPNTVKTAQWLSFMFSMYQLQSQRGD